jgi:D-alanyl-lipoteichoic acid acyltransferase DltB (MBOAT superfamily)
LRAARGRRAAAAWLVAASAAFYAWWSVAHLAMLAGLLAANFVLGGAIAARRGLPSGKALLAAGVTGNLGVLVYFKYAGFLGNLFAPETAVSLRLADIVLPLAISFFTF